MQQIIVGQHLTSIWLDSALFLNPSKSAYLVLCIGSSGARLHEGRNGRRRDAEFWRRCQRPELFYLGHRPSSTFFITFDDVPKNTDMMHSAVSGEWRLSLASKAIFRRCIFRLNFSYVTILAKKVESCGITHCVCRCSVLHQSV